jgi:hypothetical protein
MQIRESVGNTAKKTDLFTIFVFQNGHNNKLLAVYILPSNTTVFYGYYYIEHVLVCTACAGLNVHNLKPSGCVETVLQFARSRKFYSSHKN